MCSVEFEQSEPYPNASCPSHPAPPKIHKRKSHSMPSNAENKEKNNNIETTHLCNGNTYLGYLCCVCMYYIYSSESNFSHAPTRHCQGQTLTYQQSSDTDILHTPRIAAPPLPTLHHIHTPAYIFLYFCIHERPSSLCATAETSSHTQTTHTHTHAGRHIVEAAVVG